MNDIEKNLPYPVFVKPASRGSSIGVTRANDRASLKEALELAFEFDRKTLVEKGLCVSLSYEMMLKGHPSKVAIVELDPPQYRTIGIIALGIWFIRGPKAPPAGDIPAFTPPQAGQEDGHGED